MKEEINDIIKTLITRYLSGETSPEENEKLQAWRKEDEDHEHMFTEFEKTYHLSKPLDKNEATQTIDIEAEWEHFKQSTDETKMVTLAHQLTNSWLKVAASVTLLAIIGIAINYFLNSQQTTLLQTGNELKSVTLPDGSMIDLNQNTTLSYSSGFGKDQRTVRLTGEAYFQVKNDPSAPFIIQVNNAEVRVVGTSFNVRGYENTAQIEVVVTNGLVNLTGRDPEDSIQLGAGEKGVYDKCQGQLQELTNDNINFLSWKTREFIFEEATLQEVITSLNQVYDKQVVIKTALSDTCLISVTFKQQSLEAIMNVLESTLNLTYHHLNDTIEIVDAACE